MILAALLWASGASSQSLTDQIQNLLTARDVDGLAKLSGGALDSAHFAYVRRGGAYGSGAAGWKAIPFQDQTSGRRLMVFSTNINVEDIGEQVYEVDDQRIIRHLPERESLGWSAPDVDLKASFAPKEKRALLSATFRVRAQNPSQPLLLRLSPQYRVKKATQGSAPAPFVQAGGVVSLKAAPGASPVTLEYEAVVDQPGFAGVIEEKEVLLTNDYFWPHIARQPVKGTTVMTLPKGWYGITVGSLVSDKTSGAERVMTYRNSLPVSFLSLSAGEFRVAEIKKGSRTYGVVSRALTAEQMTLQAELLPPIFEFFSTLKPHPYPSYHAVDTKLYVGGALEAYSYATYGHGWLPDEDPHEPSHTWWGGIIPNTYLKSLWNESFAVFSEGLYQREGSIGKKEDKRLAFVHPYDGNPFSSFPLDVASSEVGSSAVLLGYGKGGFVLQQLELEAGRAQMTTWLKQWLARHEPGQLGEWEDFEAVAGPAWKPFFDQWVRRAGWPRMTFPQNPTAVPLPDGKLRLSQPVNFTGPSYDLKIEVLARGAFGRRVVLGTISKGVLTADVPAGTKSIALDPFTRVASQRGQTGRLSWDRSTRGLKPAVDPGRKAWAAGREAAPWDGKELAGRLLIGHPKTMPAIRPLLARAGFVVKGENLTYRGITISLSKGSAVAILPLEGDKVVGILLGQSRRPASVGQARVAVVDGLGRFLAGETDPRTTFGAATLP